MPFYLGTCNAVFGIDPGVAQGVLHVGGDVIPLTNAYTHFHDNTEKLLHRPGELRILLADREVRQEALRGIAFPQLMEVAHEGRVRGLLLQLDPNGDRQVVVTVLGAKQPFMTQIADVQTVVKNLSIANNRVKGEIAHDDGGAVRYAVHFSAPLFSELRVTADLKGKAAKQSEQARVMREKARALARADYEAVRRLSTARANRKLDALISRMGAQADTAVKAAGAALEKSLSELRRVVVRGDSAVVIVGDKQWMTLEREGGEWRSDD